MKGVFWNCMGAGRKGMASCFADIIKDHSLDFVGIQETKKKEFPAKYLSRVDPGGFFVWNCLPSVGRSGGILCGVKKESLELISWKLGNFMVQARVFDVKNKCIWVSIVVYGAAHDDHKEDFLNEMLSTCSSVDVPYIIGGGYFNIIRGMQEKNKKHGNLKFVAKFNDVINSLGLREVDMGGGKYTWTNKQRHPTLEKLDRVLMSFSWEDLYPLVSVRKLVREVSDHNPLLLSTGMEERSAPGQREFRFELSWLKNEEFFPKAKSIWEQVVRADDPIDILNIKLKRIKKYFKGWGSNRFGHSRKRKDEIKKELEEIEKLEEMGPLDPEIYEKRTLLCAEYNEILYNDELFWLQQSNERWLLKGDRNTSFFS